MGNRGGPFPAGAAVLAVLLGAMGPLDAPASPKRPSTPRRIIAVEVLADPALRSNEIWKIDIFLAVRDVSQTLAETFGIVLKIRTCDYWAHGPIAGAAEGRSRAKTLGPALSAFNRHIQEAGRGPSEIVIGLVPEGPDGPVFPGIADYLAGTVLVKYLESKGGMPYVLLHEICHLFGAVDLAPSGSVMSLRKPRFRLDDFTKSIIRANRERSFLPGEFPLTEGQALEAIALYEARQTLGLGEKELVVCLGKLREACAERRFARR